MAASSRQTWLAEAPEPPAPSAPAIAGTRGCGRIAELINNLTTTPRNDPIIPAKQIEMVLERGYRSNTFRTTRTEPREDNSWPNLPNGLKRLTHSSSSPYQYRMPSVGADWHYPARRRRRTPRRLGSIHQTNGGRSSKSSTAPFGAPNATPKARRKSGVALTRAKDELYV